MELIFRPQGNAISLLPKLVGILVLRGALLAPSWLLLGRLGGSWGLSAPIWAPSWPLAGRLWASLGLSAPIISSRKLWGLIGVLAIIVEGGAHSFRRQLQGLIGVHLIFRRKLRGLIGVAAYLRLFFVVNYGG